MMRKMILATCALLALGATGAQAATPVPAGAGSQPAVALDAAGTAHLAWQSSDNSVGVCRLPTGATACMSVAELALPVGLTAGSPITGINVFAPDAADVEVDATGLADSGKSKVVQWASTDGGATFNSGTVLNVDADTTTTEAVTTRGSDWRTPAGLFLSAGGSATGEFFQAFAPGQPQAASQTPIFDPGDDNDYAEAVGVQGSGPSALLAVMSRSLAANALVYTTFKLSPDTATVDQLNTAANWNSQQQVLGNDGELVNAPALVSGPSGMFAVSDAHPAGSSISIAVRKLDPTTRTFGSPHYIPVAPSDDQALAASAWAAEDAGGGLHIIWRDGTNLRYLRSTDGGQSFTEVGTIATDAAEEVPRLAVGADGHGVAVYTSTSGTVEAVPLEALPTTTPGSGTRTTTVRVAGARVAVAAPRACVRPGAKVTIIVAVQHKGRRVLRIRRVDFSIAGKRVARDRRAPFVDRVRVPGHARSKSTLRLNLSVYMALRHGGSTVKRTTRRFTVC
jgi:hypothetical protein